MLHDPYFTSDFTRPVFMVGCIPSSFTYKLITVRTLLWTYDVSLDKQVQGKAIEMHFKHCDASWSIIKAFGSHDRLRRYRVLYLELGSSVARLLSCVLIVIR
jgi:hypothetical protein